MNDLSVVTLSDAQTKAERRARWVYVWLLLSAFITVPWMQINLSQFSRHHDRLPAWSPDSKKIAYVSNDGVLVMDTDGGNRTRVSDHAFSPLAWSPDGEKIAFTVGGTVQIASAHGGNVKDIHSKVFSPPVWSPDGSQVAYATSQGILISNADGRGGDIALTTGSTDDYLSWSPDGKSIVYGSNGTLFVVDTQLKTRSQLRAEHDDSQPVWSPDGRYIALVSKRHRVAVYEVGNYMGDVGRILIVTSDGNRTLGSSQGTYDYNPAWAPDGNRIAFEREKRIYQMNTDGTGERLVTAGRYPSWSPNSKQIAFYVGDSDTAMDVHTVNLETGEIRNLTGIPLTSFLLAVLFPAVVQIVPLLGLVSGNLYVRHHAQQGLILAFLRVLSATALVGLTRGEGTLAWSFVNGSLWLFGSIWGLRQVSRGDCWMMRLRGERSLLPRPWATAPSLPVSQPRYPWEAERGASVAVQPLQLQVAGGADNATVEKLLELFRHGSAEEQQEALVELEKLGQVGKF